MLSKFIYERQKNIHFQGWESDQVGSGEIGIAEQGASEHLFFYLFFSPSQAPNPPHVVKGNLVPLREQTVTAAKEIIKYEVSALFERIRVEGVNF
jgi:hypothetical protein